MMRYFIYIILFACMSCIDSNTNSIYNSSSNVKGYDTITSDRLKWSFYSLNYLGKAYFFDSISKKQIGVSPITCDVVLTYSFQKNKDSLIYNFEFYKKNCKFLYSQFDVVGFEVNNNIIIPFSTHAHFTFENNKDSMQSLLFEADKGFCKYLSTYNGEISNWLKYEARRRSCISKKNISPLPPTGLSIPK